MKKINLAISGCMGRMGQQLIKSSKKNKKFKLVTLTENRSVNKKFAGIKPELNSEIAFKKIDVIIDFTVPDCTLEILKILNENDEITSNEIVAKLVGNGLSYDYASKVKNKIIESLNDKFQFVTKSSESFINISKSPQDKRIQTLSLLKD